MRTLLAMAAVAMMSVPYAGALRATDGDNPSSARSGTLTVSAPVEYCAGASYDVEICQYDWGYAFGGPIKRVHAAHADCRWRFEDMPEGHYTAAIRTARGDRVVVAAGGDLSRGEQLDLHFDTIASNTSTAGQ